jgi:hypothetical protein
MKKIEYFVIPLFTIVILISRMFCQSEWECGMDYNQTDRDIDQCDDYLLNTPNDPVWRDNNIPDITDSKTIRIIFHIFNDDDGSNPNVTESAIYEQIDILNYFYGIYHIQFIASLHYHNSTYYRNVEVNFDDEELINDFKFDFAELPEQQLNIYLVNMNGGISFFPWNINENEWWRNGVVIGANIVDYASSTYKKILVHEIGHSLGLWHTFHGYDELCEIDDSDCDRCVQPCYEDMYLPVSDECLELNNEQECTNNVDCYWTDNEYCYSIADQVGDRCSDTSIVPRDPNCHVIVGLNECTGIAWYDPDSEPINYNYMGYGFTDFTCSGDPYFTAQQSGRMHAWLDYSLSGWFEGSDVHEITFTNILYGTNINLGGTLSVINHDNDTIEVESGSTIQVDIEDNYTIQTNHIEFINEGEILRHYNNNYIGWDNEIIKRNYQFTNEMINFKATYKRQETINFILFDEFEYEFYSTWYVINPDSEPYNWEQPNEFLPISEIAPDGTYDVFLNQNEGFYDNLAIYRLWTPQYYATTDGIYEFSHWSGDGVYFDMFLSTTYNRETNIVFSDGNATFQPHYTEITDLSQNFTLDSGETLTIPAGASYLLSNSFGLTISEGAILIVEGTEESPVTFQSLTVG